MSRGFEFDSEWARWMNEPELARHANEQGLRRAGAQALEIVNDNFKRRGRPKFKALTKAYAKRKRAGKAAPGRQLGSSFAGKADLMLTGALRQAAAFKPRSKLAGDTLELWPDPTVKLGDSAVGAYADAANEEREYFSIPRSEDYKFGPAYETGFFNVLHGIPDPVGRHL